MLARAQARLRTRAAWRRTAALGLADLSAPIMTWTALAVGVMGGVANLAIRRPVPAPAHV